MDNAGNEVNREIPTRGLTDNDGNEVYRLSGIIHWLDTRVGISRSASETDDWLIFLYILWKIKVLKRKFTINGFMTANIERHLEVFVTARKFVNNWRHFYAPPQKVAGYYVISSELLSVCPSVRPSATHSCPLHNFDTVRDNFTKLGTNINHDQTTCRD